MPGPLGCPILPKGGWVCLSVFLSFCLSVSCSIRRPRRCGITQGVMTGASAWSFGVPHPPEGRVGLSCAPSDSPTLIRRGWGTRGVCGISGRRISSAAGVILCRPGAALSRPDRSGVLQPLKTKKPEPCARALRCTLWCSYTSSSTLACQRGHALSIEKATHSEEIAKNAKRH